MLTSSRSLFKVRNTLCFFMVLRSAMSLGNKRGCSRALATYPALPCWKSLIEESIGRGDSLNTKGGSKPEPWCDDHAPSPQQILRLRTSFEQSWPLWPPSGARFSSRKTLSFLHNLFALLVLLSLLVSRVKLRSLGRWRSGGLGLDVHLRHIAPCVRLQAL